MSDASTSDLKPRPNNDTGKQLNDYLDRVERLKDEQAVLGEDIKDIKKEMKGRGFDMKLVAEMLRLRKMSKDERDEFEDIRTTYGHALGLFG